MAHTTECPQHTGAGKRCGQKVDSSCKKSNKKNSTFLYCFSSPISLNVAISRGAPFSHPQEPRIGVGGPAPERLGTRNLPEITTHELLYATIAHIPVMSAQNPLQTTSFHLALTMAFRRVQDVTEGALCLKPPEEPYWYKVL